MAGALRAELFLLKSLKSLYAAFFKVHEKLANRIFINRLKLIISLRACELSLNDLSLFGYY